jgi:hypothetical protein
VTDDSGWSSGSFNKTLCLSARKRFNLAAQFLVTLAGFGKKIRALALPNRKPSSRVARLAASARGHIDKAHFGRSIRTISEFSRKRSNTICLPSGVMSKVRVNALLLRWVSVRVFFVARSSSRKSCCDSNCPCI